MSTEIFQFCTSLSARPESPRASSVAMIANVWVCVAGSSAMPPNSSGTPRYRMPISSAFSRMCGISRCAGSACHSRQRSAAIHGMTTSST